MYLFYFCLQFYRSFRTLIADVEARVVVWLIGDELDPHRRALADHALKGDLPAPARVEQHHGAGVQPAPQHQPAGTGTEVASSYGVAFRSRSLNWP